MTVKLELASRAWLDELFGLLRKAAAANPGIEFSVCEVFTDVPERLKPDSQGRVAWHGRIMNGTADLHLGEVAAEDVDVMTVGDWESLLPAARAKVEMTPEGLARYRQLTADAVAAGRIMRYGDASKAPLELMAIHNTLADMTA